MLASMNDGKLMDFDGREEAAAAKKRRRDRIMERQTVVEDKKKSVEKEQLQKEALQNDKEVTKNEEIETALEEEENDNDKKGLAAAVSKQKRKWFNTIAWNSIQQKTSIAKTIEYLAGSDYIDAVTNANLIDLKKGNRLKYGEDSLQQLYKKQRNAFDSGSGSGSGSDSSSSSDSDSSDEEE